MPRFYRLAVLVLSAFLCAALLLGCGGDGSPEPGPEPTTEVTVSGLGVLRGARASAFQDVAYFKGIPFAKPPTGDLRWKPPQAHGPWDSPRDATSFGAACFQERDLQKSEDCLFLNVAAPASALGSTAALPVMLWIYGGGYQSGSSSENGEPTIATPDTLVAASGLSVIVVTVNYRLNIFGFLGSAEIAGSTADNSAGNFGIQDQRMAMAWVKEHIAAFGGNGDSITIFGESAGANSVINHLAQSASFPFYTKAIIQSGTYDEGALSMEKAEEAYQNVLLDTSCPDLACLRALDTATIYAKRNTSGTGPVVDGVELTGTPADLIAQGRHSKVPVLMGAVRDEMMSPMFNPHPWEMNEAYFDAVFTALDADRDGPSRLAPAKAIYDPSVYTYPADRGPYSIWAWTLGRMLTDQVPGLGACGVRWLAKSLLAAGTPAVYSYSFDHPPQRPSMIPGDGPGSVIAGHACEIAFVFGQTSQLTAGDERKLAADMSAYFVQFAKTGDPNVQGLPAWPAYAAQTDTILRFDVGAEGIRTWQDFRKEACDFWEFVNATGEEELIVV